ncbi:uncharacterized protein FOMMEDRAFT_113569 [Fomitiporia mediterranea MF3/22]|uniref:uncharacterized protein n=1 Tax=Fomitiporia mediterranea (strain MF3/22) TaxID=694068 RepID=UPI0004408149|nr:uncharacterized protein FOMMEDRAFT_113569 [Fomitiporia mediterranea MF3/22]EJC98969.1 hypothetical protein FOMMEDRAFT_113569 [Fomitiporia mediterranea MF3/22]
MQSSKVLIVGSGPAGLILGLSLLKNGIPVRIIEKDVKHHNGERGSGVMPRTLEIEHFLGTDEVHKTGASLATIHIFDPKDPYRIIRSSRTMQDIESTPACPITRSVVLGQWRHQAILRKHIEALGGKVELGSAFIGCTQDENGVMAEIHKVIDGVEQTEKARFEYLVGADGGRSTSNVLSFYILKLLTLIVGVVRKDMGVNFLGETRTEGRLHLVDARIKGLDVDTDVRMWGSFSSALVVLRQTVQPGLFQVAFSGPETRFDYLKEHDDPQTIQDELQRITNRTDLQVTEIIWHGEWRPNIRMVDRFQVGRLFIIGDAAHTHSPTGGQGLNSSVQDAFNLAWKLALTIKGTASPRLLESYEGERLPVIAEMLKLTTKLLDRFIQTDTNPEKYVKEAAEKQSNKNTRNEDIWFRDRKLLQLDLHYRWSPVVVDERFLDPNSGPTDVYGVSTNEKRAGDRAPDAPSLSGVNAPDRLFDIFNPAMHTVLLFVADQSLVEQAHTIIAPLSSIDGGLIQKVLVFPAGVDASNFSTSDMKYIVVDLEGHAFTNYGVNRLDGSPTVVIVRPDAMIGAFLKTEAGTRKYISAVFLTNP